MGRKVSALTAGALAAGILAFIAPAANASAPGEACAIPGAKDRATVDVGGGVQRTAVLSCVAAGGGYVWTITNYVQPGIN